MLWRGKERKKWQRFLSRFSNQLSYQVNNQSLADGSLGGYDPFVNSVAQEDIISTSNSLNNTFYFNQLSSIWGINYNYSNRSTKSLLTYGLEGDQVKLNNVETRFVFARKLTLKITGTTGNRNHQSAMEDDDQTYQIKQNALNPELSWISQNKIRLLVGVKQDWRDNAPEWGGEQAIIRSINFGFRLNSLNTGNLNITGTYSGIKFDGKDNTPVSFVLLDALKKGSNWLWHVTWERNIGKGLQISLDYDGRKSVGTKIIHTGTMSIRALL